MKVKVVVDSTSYLSREALERYDIKVVPLLVTLGEETFREGTVYTNAEYYGRLRKVKIFPRTSQPAAGDFLEVFQGFEKGSEVICVLISEMMSGTVQSAETAASMVEGVRVTVFDSRSVAMGTGFLSLRAAEMADQGASMEEIVEELVRIRSKLKVFFVVDNLEYLVRGGRLSKTQGLLGNLLLVKPILYVNDGKIELFEKVRTRQKAIARILEELTRDVEKSQVEKVCVAHVDALNEALELKEKVNNIYKGPLTLEEAGPVVGSHSGPGTVGLVYY